MNGCLKIEHDPHVGIEWEPQFTLLNHKKKAVYFNYLSDYNASKASITRLWESGISIELPANWRSVYLSIDNTNIEVRTKYCRFSRLEEEIKKSQKRLERFTVRLAKEFGPVGVFLPSSNPCDYNVRCYKHFNIKILNYDPFAILEFGDCVRRMNDLYEPSQIVDIRGWYSKRHRRMHIKVPYDFDGYEKMIAALGTGNDSFNSFADVIETALENASEKPILLGYSYGRKYIRRNSLV